PGLGVQSHGKARHEFAPVGKVDIVGAAGDGRASEAQVAPLKGAGGVDHPAIWAMLNDRGYNGWITLDLDPPRPNEGEGSVDDKIGINCRYLTETLQVAHF
ncbi:MAG TPA: hypothetical protein PKE45_15420, partial [Caldilineaceae bacterium]|nr:hypothetical protein [Caldilineaceae bacterium]